MEEPKVLRILLFGVLLCLMTTCEARRREYFVAMEEIEWEYEPRERQSEQQKLEGGGVPRILSYKKAVFRQYTDSTFTVKSNRPPGLGLYGPILRAEVKDMLVVYALNRASRPYSIHPHGVFYLKDSEGALYADNTTDARKDDDAIPPGESHTYIWEVRDEYGPGPKDPNCLPWAYHSHVDSLKDQNSGLVGTILTCRKGTLSSNGLRTDVNREFSIIAFAVDENQSWYTEENIQNRTANPETIDRKNPSFVTSNIMYSINGKTWEGLSGLEMCEGDLVHWYMIGLGSEPHTMQFVGNTAIVDGHRLDTVNLMPAIFSTAVMRADNPGTWLLECHYTNHTTAGMLVQYKIHDKCGPSMGVVKKGRLNGNIRKYYIAAEEMEWDFSPPRINFLTRSPIDGDGQPSAKYFKQGPDRIGGTYIKALYREYTDETFEQKVEPNSVLGIMGPVIAAEVGDTIEVLFKNNANRSYGMEAHGVFLEKIDFSGVKPGSVKKYIWRVPPSVSPTDKDKNCVPYLYTSFATLGTDQHTGLVGPVLICKKDTLDMELAKPPHFVLFTVFDENLSPYLQRNIEKFTSDPLSVDTEDDDFKESNRMRAINGLSYGSYAGLSACAGEATDLYLLSVGSEINTHSLVVSGGVVKHRSEYTGMFGVLPHAVATVTVTIYDPARGLFACHMTNHIFNGMFGFYQSRDCGTMPPKFVPSRTGKFYLGAVEEVWDYLPNRTDHEGNSVDDVDHPAYLVSRQKDGEFIGTRYKKAIYYEYTDETFTERKPKPAHFGFHGPLVKMEIGDEIEIIFKNMASRPYTALAVGVHRVSHIPPLQPGETTTYVWQARPELTPTDDQPDCFSTQYFSLADFYDPVTGLHGPILICKKGGYVEHYALYIYRALVHQNFDGALETLELGKGGGADEEFYLLFNIDDENNSHYIDDNIREFAKVDPETFDKKNKDFVESNKMNHINGLMYHVPGIDMKRGDLVRWHLNAEGEEEVHTVHFHANAFVHQSDKESRNDVLGLVAGVDTTVMMRPDAVGKWLLHCHVNTHANIGMTTTYRVAEAIVTCKSPCLSCVENTRLDCSLLGIKRSSDLLNGNSKVRILKNKEISFVPSNQVTHLDLSGNTDLGDVEKLHALLSKFPNLRVLNLNSINLSELPKGLFAGHQSLTYLRAQNNRIRNIDEEYLNGEENLRVLDLKGNDLRQISSNIFVGRGWKLKKLDLRGNPNLQPPCLNALHVEFAIVRACFQLPGFDENKV